MNLPLHLDDYLKLADFQQQQILYTSGTLIDSELCGNLIFTIYAIDQFLVEVVYDTEKDIFVSRRAFLPEKAQDNVPPLNPGSFSD